MTSEKIAQGMLKQQGSFTGLDLAGEVQKIKIFFNITSSLLNANLINEQVLGREDLINTWDPPKVTNEQRFGGTETKRASRSNAPSSFYATGADYHQYKSLG